MVYSQSFSNEQYYACTMTILRANEHFEHHKIWHLAEGFWAGCFALLLCVERIYVRWNCSVVLGKTHDL